MASTTATKRTTPLNGILVAVYRYKTMRSLWTKAQFLKLQQMAITLALQSGLQPWREDGLPKTT
jgi:hypothetical protein